MVKLFRSADSIALLLLAVLAVLLNANLFIVPELAKNFTLIEQQAPIGQLYAQLINGAGSAAYYIAAGFFIFFTLLQSLLLHAIVERNKLFEKENALVAFAFILLVSLFNTHLLTTTVPLAIFGIILSLSFIYEAVTSEGQIAPFNAGFSVGVAAICFHPALIFLLYVCLALSTVRVFNVKEWVLCGIGAIIPLFWCGVFYLLTGQFDVFFSVTTHAAQVPEIQFPITELFVKAAIVLMILTAIIILFQTRLLQSLVRIRKLLTVLIHLSTVGLLVFILNENFHLSPIGFLNIPLSVFLAYIYYRISNQMIGEGINAIIIIALIYFQYFNN